MDTPRTLYVLGRRKGVAIIKPGQRGNVRDTPTMGPCGQEGYQIALYGFTRTSVPDLPLLGWN
jgi:hypothetical protein